MNSPKKLWQSDILVVITTWTEMAAWRQHQRSADEL